MLEAIVHQKVQNLSYYEAHIKHIGTNMQYQ